MISSDALYAILAFLGSALLLGIQRALDQRKDRAADERKAARARASIEKIGWAELFVTGRRIERRVLELLWLPHPLSNPTPQEERDAANPLRKALEQELDALIDELYLLDAKHPEGKLNVSIWSVFDAIVSLVDLTKYPRNLDWEGNDRLLGKLSEALQEIELELKQRSRFDRNT